MFIYPWFIDKTYTRVMCDIFMHKMEWFILCSNLQSEQQINLCDIHLGMRKVFWKDWICNLDCFETYHVELLWRLLVNQLFLEIHAVFSEKLQSQLFLTDDRWHQFKKNFLNRYLSRYSPLVLLIKNRLVFKFPQFPIPILF